MSSATTAKHSNNFDIIRLVAACMVMVAHAYKLWGIDYSYQYGKNSSAFIKPVWDLLNYLRHHAGHLGVYFFFLISGYLITISWVRSKTANDYLKKRSLRIFPGLYASLLFVVLILGPALTNLPLVDFFTNKATWYYLLNGPYQKLSTGLPGLFQDNQSDKVNGSLWTLTYEFYCYLVIMVMGWAGVFAKKWWLELFYISLMVATFWGTNTVAQLDGLYIDSLDIYPVYMLVFLQAFMTGSLFYKYQNQIKLKGWMALTALVVIVLCHQQSVFDPSAIDVVMYGIFIFWLSYIPIPAWLRNPFGSNDFSYGMYIYGMPIQQAMLALGATALNPTIYMGLSILMTFPFAVASWFLVEKPALKFK